jgi:hypothetical protein
MLTGSVASSKTQSAGTLIGEEQLTEKLGALTIAQNLQEDDRFVFVRFDM